MARKKKARKKIAGKKKTAEKASKKIVKKARKRYTEGQKSRLLKKYEELRKEMNTDAAAKKVGVSYMSLRNWQEKSGKKPVMKVKKAALKKAAKRGPAKKGPAKKVVTGNFTLKISGPDMQIERTISGNVVSQIVKLIF